MLGIAAILRGPGLDAMLRQKLEDQAGKHSDAGLDQWVDKVAKPKYVSRSIF